MSVLGDAVSAIGAAHAPCIILSANIPREGGELVGSQANGSLQVDGCEAGKVVVALAAIKSAYLLTCEEVARKMGVGDQELLSQIAEVMNEGQLLDGRVLSFDQSPPFGTQLQRLAQQYAPAVIFGARIAETRGPAARAESGAGNSFGGQSAAVMLIALAAMEDFRENFLNGLAAALGMGRECLDRKHFDARMTAGNDHLRARGAPMGGRSSSRTTSDFALAKEAALRAVHDTFELGKS